MSSSPCAKRMPLLLLLLLLLHLLLLLLLISLLLFRGAARHFMRSASPPHECFSACRYVAGGLGSAPCPCGHRGGPLDAKLRGNLGVCGAELLEV